MSRSNIVLSEKVRQKRILVVMTDQLQFIDPGARLVLQGPCDGEYQHLFEVLSKHGLIQLPGRFSGFTRNYRNGGAYSNDDISRY